MPNSRNRQGHKGRVAARALVRQPASQIVQIGALIANVADGSLSIDLTKLESPTQVYDADVAWMEYERGVVLVCFAAMSRDNSTQLRSLLTLKYPPEDFVRAFWGNSRIFHDRVRGFSAGWGQQHELEQRDSLKPEQMKAPKEHSVWVSFEYMAQSGSKAAVDFYYIPTPGVARFAAHKGVSGLGIEPVVRVQLTTLELLYLLNRADKFVDELCDRIPALKAAKAEVVDASATQQQDVTP